MLTPDLYLAMPPEERRSRLEAAAERLGPPNAPPVTRLAVSLDRGERTIYDWLENPKRIPFVVMALLEAWEREHLVIEARESLEAAETALDRARKAARVARAKMLLPHQL